MRGEGANFIQVFDPGGADPGAISINPRHSVPFPADFDEDCDILAEFDNDAPADYDMEPDDPTDGVPLFATDELDLPDDLEPSSWSDPHVPPSVESEVALYLSDLSADPVAMGVQLRDFQAMMPAILDAGRRARQIGLTALLDEVRAPLMLRGCLPSVIATECAGYPHLRSLLDLKIHGYRYVMAADWTPTAGADSLNPRHISGIGTCFTTPLWRWPRRAGPSSSPWTIWLLPTWRACTSASSSMPSRPTAKAWAGHAST